jgi:hypothetical protein
MGFGKGEAIGVIGQHDGPLQPFFQVLFQGPSIKGGGIAILHRLQGGVQYAGGADPDGAGAEAGGFFHFSDQQGDLPDDMIIAFIGFGIYACPEEGVGMTNGFQDDAFDLGPTEVNAP